MNDVPNNIVLITNEFVILFSSYFVLVFSDYVTDVETRYTFGFVYLSFFLLQTVINIAMFLIVTGKDIRKYLHQRKLKKQIK